MTDSPSNISTEQNIHVTSAENSFLPVVFSGKSGEFFKIWIVNILFSVLTLGIYSAWAKVRTNQYFHGHTSLDGHRFRYLATPIQILKGRLIAVAIFVVFAGLSTLFPLASIALYLLFFIAFPWLLIQGIRFGLRMTSYRNVRFDFTSTYWEMFVICYIYPLIGMLSLWLAYPWVLKKIDEHIHSRIRFGNKMMFANTDTGTYYVAVLVSMACTAGLIIFISIFSIVLSMGLSIDMWAWFATVSESEADAVQASVGNTFSVYFMMAVTVAIYWLGLTIISAVYQSIIRNHLLSSLSVDNVANLKSDVQVIPFVGLKVTNALILLFTFGLGYPVTVIRKTRFLLQATHVQKLHGADKVIDDIGTTDTAFGEEAGEVFDVDFSLG